MKKKFKTAIVGTGLIANAAHLPAIEYMGDEYDVVAVADIRPEAAEETAAKYDIKKIYTDYRKLLDEVKPEVTIVATPNGSHMEISMAALQHGSNVICEKPVVLSYKDAVTLFTEADKHGVGFFPAQTARFFTDRLAVKKLVDDGLLGDIYFADFEAVRRRGIPRWGFFHKKEFNVGGPFCDLGVHEIDHMLWVLGNPKPITVSGSAWTKIGNSGEELQTSLEQAGNFGGLEGTPMDYDWQDFNVEDMTTGLIRLEGDRTITFKASWAVNLETSWRREYAGTTAGLSYTDVIPPMIYGGVSGWQSNTQPLIYGQIKYPEHIVFPGHIGLLQNVADVLRGKAEPVVKKAETLNVSTIIEAFYASAAAHKEIVCSDLTK